MTDPRDISPVERSRAFKAVFGKDGTRSREQEIVYNELCGQFMFYPVFQLVPEVGMDVHLAAVLSGKTEIAKTIYDNINTPEVLIDRPEPTVTRKKDKHVQDDD